jgi:hypothetical protein
MPATKLKKLLDEADHKQDRHRRDQATFTNLDFWANGLSRPDGSEELAHFGLEALVFVGEQLR